MIRLMRERMGRVVVVSIIGAITLVFVFDGLISGSRFSRGGADAAGKVNGEVITLGEFHRALQQKTAMFENLKIPREQLKFLRLHDNVFQELVQRRLMLSSARHLGLTPSTDEIREKIQSIEAFKKDGRFQVDHYKAVLEANHLTPAAFEKMMTDDLMIEQARDYFGRVAIVPDAEIDQHYREKSDKRVLRYVLLTPEMGQKKLTIAAAAVEAFLKNPGKQGMLQARFNAQKDARFKGKTFEQVRSEIAQDLLRGEQVEAYLKILDQEAAKVAEVLGVQADAKVDASLKALGAKVIKSAELTRATEYLPGVGMSGDLLKDAFDKPESLMRSKGGKAKIYSLPAGKLVAIVDSVKSAEAKGPTVDERKKLRDELAQSLERSLLSSWLKSVTDKAKIERYDGSKPDATADAGDSAEG